MDERAQQRLLVRAGRALVPGHGSGTFPVVNPQIEAIAESVLSTSDPEEFDAAIDYAVDEFLDVERPARSVRALAVKNDNYTDPSSPYVRVLGPDNAAEFAEFVKASQMFVAGVVAAGIKPDAEPSEPVDVKGFLLGDAPLVLREIIFELFRGSVASAIIQLVVRRGSFVPNWKATALVKAFGRGVEAPVALMLSTHEKLEKGEKDQTTFGVSKDVLAQWAKRARTEGPFSPLADDVADEG